tara:strand:+ start:176 stop:412 length:237 start_codon:yes stop_codon:yes gene_type:complete
MNDVSATIDRIRAYLADEFKGSKAGFARKAGLSINSLRDIDAADWNPRASTLSSLASVIPSDWRPTTSGANGINSNAA